MTKVLLLDCPSRRVMFLSVCFCSFLNFAQGFPYYEQSNDLHKEDYSSDLRRMQLECIDETRVDPDSVLQLKSGYWSKADFALRDWVLCLLVKSGIMTKQGVFMMDEALAKVPIDDQLVVEKKIDKCLYAIKRKGIPQNVAWLYVKCYNAANPKKLVLL